MSELSSKKKFMQNNILRLQDKCSVIVKLDFYIIKIYFNISSVKKSGSVGPVKQLIKLKWPNV